MRVQIDQDRCQGHGMCLLGCPELFDLNDEDGHAFLRDPVVPPELADKVASAAQSCPEGAITIVE